jgi:hypothetical protein
LTIIEDVSPMISGELSGFFGVSGIYLDERECIDRPVPVVDLQVCVHVPELRARFIRSDRVSPSREQPRKDRTIPDPSER